MRSVLGPSANVIVKYRNDLGRSRPRYFVVHDFGKTCVDPRIGAFSLSWGVPLNDA